MFHNIPEAILTRMAALETIDQRDRQDGTPHMQRLRQIPAETGKFLALLAAMAPHGRLIEIGTSAGYSTMWLSLALRPITTFEVLPGKVEVATTTFAQTGLAGQVTLVAGDARAHLPHLTDIALCFVDAEKDVYADCYEAVVPNLVHGGLFVADNAISHAEALRPFLDHAQEDGRVDALVVPIGKGILLCRKRLTIND
ncbi:MAG: class I SAM-dependent methyltransferase [Anaerolinea sp.]|nr:class I SAM-dependent methyltransferase [Anaerolinea sp.]